MESPTLARVLCVDDDPNVLQGLARTLRRSFDVTTAVGGAAGLAMLDTNNPFAIVVSDLRMPHMDGVSFLSRVRQTSPDSVRVLLTGQADLESAIGAVNDGAIFRFLTKPVTPEVLLQALSAAEAQHRLVTAERVLLEETLRGSIKALTDILALVSPAAFGRALRAKQRVSEIADHARLNTRWQIEVAAMLSQIGSVTLAPDTVEKLYQGGALTHAETIRVERLPTIASEVIASIPRMQEVQQILSHLNCRYDGGQVRALASEPRGKAIPLGARLLRLILDLDVLETQGMPTPLALDTLRGREGWYDLDLLDAFAEMSNAHGGQQVIETELRAIRPGMVFAEDVKSENGLLLVARGQEVSERLVERVRNVAHLAAAKQRVKVIVPSSADQSAHVEVVPA